MERISKCVTYTEAMRGQIWLWKGPVYVTNVTYTEVMHGQICPWKGPVYVTHVTYAGAMCGQIWPWRRASVYSKCYLH